MDTDKNIHLFLKFNKILFLILLLFPAENAFASQHTGPAVTGSDDRETSDRKALKTEKGLIMLDYEVIPVAEDKSLDLLGFHFLYQSNSWLLLGIGAHAPLVDGDYGGFMAIDATIHTQRKILGNLFVDAGVSLGGGGGGSSIDQSKELSGEGGYAKSYVGLGYDFSSFSVGMNYAHFQFMDSLIDHSQLNFFIQKPLSFFVGSYADSGKAVASDVTFPEAGENILTLEFNNIFQIEPVGSNKENINTLSLQLSHFLNGNHYLFLSADIGYYGLPLYNQFLGGIGYAYSFSPRVNFYGEIGFGSGGFSPDVIDTGSGLLVYPELSVEYLLNNKIGLSLSGGYLFAPEGSSKNYTAGAALNYHLSTEERSPHGFGTGERMVFRGFRFNAYQQTEFDVQFEDKNHGNINMISVQFDKVMNDNWYIPFQASVAYNDFWGYPGYGEILTGLGVQNKYAAENRFQSFFQIAIGVNIHSVMLKPSIGTNYYLSDHFALYAQAGRTMSLYKISGLSEYDKYNRRMSSNFIGLGLTYRFSLPDTL